MAERSAFESLQEKAGDPPLVFVDAGLLQQRGILVFCFSLEGTLGLMSLRGFKHSAPKVSRRACLSEVRFTHRFTSRACHAHTGTCRQLHALGRRHQRHDPI